MSLIQLICYLGGLAGLWLGVSVMTVSGWLAQLYPFLQKWNRKQRFILLSAKRNLRYAWDGARNLADRRRNHGGYRQQAKVGGVAKVMVASKSTALNGSCSRLQGNGEVVVTTTTATSGNCGVEIDAAAGSSTSAAEHFMSTYRHHRHHLQRRSPSKQLMKQSSVGSSTTTDIDSGLSMESKTNSSSFLDHEDMMNCGGGGGGGGGCAGGDGSGDRSNSNSQEAEESIELEEEELEEGDDQTRMMIGETVKNGGDSGLGGFHFGGEMRRSKRRRHSMMAQMIGVAGLHHHNHHGSPGLFEKLPQTFTNNATPPQTGSPLPFLPSSGIHHPGQQNSHPFTTGNATPSETLKQQLRWKARRNAYWSNYSSMSTSSDDLSLISNTTSSTVTGSGSVTGIAPTTAASTAFRRMSLVNSKFSCKV